MPKDPKDRYLDPSGTVTTRGKASGRPSNESRKQRDALIKAIKRSREMQLRKQYEPAILTRVRELLVFTRSIGVSDTNISRVAAVRVEVVRNIRNGQYRAARSSMACERIIGAVQNLFAAILLNAKELDLLDERGLRPAQIRVELERSVATYEMSGIPPRALKGMYIGRVDYHLQALVDAKAEELAESCRKKGFDEVEVKVFINKEAASGIKKP